ncbi:choline transport protein, putative [Talaromyces stipitatus ATCC 10500]|uniref:Choline transport protein, putative n=1 Tax=Talaromyces stipitatus (strain ATCC 10500 / CBS 375.48 / QM 6759 / NRRL 1006) TaxID=441959 RepID=B8MHH3_TALSN|nr:choline transport protein, putative [Talaromyces stipitatus ATCC 10500]EED17152.1 choline transport protein, putative [Talaromyces stipitatus ATCC 10500]
MSEGREKLDGSSSTSKQASVFEESKTTEAVFDSVALGLVGPQVKRHLGPLSIIALGFNIANSWVAIATSIAIAIAAGGTVTVIYGAIVASFVYLMVALSLAELASVYPTAGGQYHFASVLAPVGWSRGVSYACGIMATFSWVGQNASVVILGAEAILALASFFNDGYVPKTWHYFLVFQAINAVFLIYNIFLMRKTPRIHDIAFMLTLTTFIISLITCLVRSEKQSSKAVWTVFENNTGWPDGIAFLTGLITPCFMFGGLDATLHLAEEVEQPERNVPRALMSTVSIGFITGFCFSVGMSYTITDLEDLLSNPMPIYPLWIQATKSIAAGTAFMVALVVIVLLVSNSIQQTTSRLIWSLARDDALLLSPWLSRLTLEVPGPALLLNFVATFILGCIFLGSSAAFNAIVSSAIILQILSFAIPIFFLIWSKRSPGLLPKNRAFRLPEWFGWTANIISILWAVVELVFFNFPGVIPVSGSSMNYSSAVLVVMGLVGTVNWFAYARKNYRGPRITFEFSSPT